MSEKRVKAFFLTVALLALTVFSSPPEKVWAADLFVEEGGTGTSCTRAFPCYFAYAIDTKAAAGDRIFFKQGTYKRTASSVLRITKKLYLYGGWNGNFFGDLVINPELYPSILDGEGVRPVVVILGPIEALVSTFTIQNGNAQDLPAQTIICEGEMTTGCGGGIYVSEAEVLIASNKILNNQANAGNGSGGGVHLESASGTILMNNLIQDNQALIKGGGLSIFGSTAIPPKLLQNNRFIHNSAALVGGVFFSPQTNPTIHDSIFENNIGSMSAGIYGFGPGDFARNLFQNNTGFDVIVLVEFSGNFQNNQLLNNSVSRGLVFTGSPVIISVISNNIIARSGLENGLFANELVMTVIEHNTLVGENIGTAIRVKSSTPLGLNNNIVAGYPVGIDATGSPDVVMTRHTLFDSSVSTQALNVTLSETRVGDPAFRDPAGNDFHIKLTSAARDAGTADFITTTQDIDGDPRIIGSAPDIGADEINPSFLYLPLTLH